MPGDLPLLAAGGPQLQAADSPEKVLLLLFGGRLVVRCSLQGSSTYSYLTFFVELVGSEEIAGGAVRAVAVLDALRRVLWLRILTKGPHMEEHLEYRWSPDGGLMVPARLRCACPQRLGISQASRGAICLAGGL